MSTLTLPSTPQREQIPDEAEQLSLAEDKPEVITEQCEDASSFPAYQAADIAAYAQKYLPDGFKEMVKAILEVEAPLSEEFLLSRIVQYFDRKRVTSSVWNDYELKMRGCEQYGITRRNGFLYLDSCQKIQFRVPGDILRSMEQIAPEELAAGMLTILRQEGVTDKKDLYRTLALQCGVHRLGKEISRILDNALCLIEDSVVISGDQLVLK